MEKGFFCEKAPHILSKSVAYCLFDVIWVSQMSGQLWGCLFWLMIFVVLPRPCRQILEQYLKLGLACFLPHSSQFIVFWMSQLPKVYNPNYWKGLSVNHECINTSHPWQCPSLLRWHSWLTYSPTGISCCQPVRHASCDECDYLIQTLAQLYALTLQQEVTYRLWGLKLTLIF
jgi:hypothetical protein